MKNKLISLMTVFGALTLGACGGIDVDPSSNEELGQSERRGIGVAQQHLVAGPVTVDARRSLAVTERAIVSAFSLRAVLDRLASQSGVTGLTGAQLFRQLWDTQNPSPGLTAGPHCNDVPSVNGFPYRCRTVDGAQAQNPDLEMDRYSAVGLFNRFDLAPANGADCGEYRMIFARSPSAGGRSFIIFEAVLANPRPELGLEGCRPVAKFWSDLSANADVTSRKNALVNFYFNGLSGFMPVVHVENYGLLGTGRSTTGQVRTNQFIQSPWLLREFKLRKTCASCSMFFQPVTDKTNPFGRLFASGSTEALAPEFQNTFFPSQVAALAVNDINSFSYDVPDKFNTGESAVESGVDDYTSQFSSTGTFASNIQSRLTQLGSTLTPAQIVARAKALSCAGCHQLSNGQSLGGGLTWPSSLGFTHVSEQTEAGLDGERFRVSPALTNVFLPQRKAVLENFVNSPPIQSGVAANRCLDVSGAGTALGTNVQSWECNGTRAQGWQVTPAGELRSTVAPNMCLDVSGGGTASGTNVQIWECNGTNAQRWTRTAAGELRSAVAPNMCLDISGGGTANGTNVQIWGCNGTQAQQWFETPRLANAMAGSVPITIHDVRLNGGSNTLVAAVRGQSIQIAVNYTITQSSTCPSCIDQILIGLQTGPLGCVFDGIPSGTGTSGTGLLNITAPDAPGVYYVRFRYAQAFSCDPGWWTVDWTPSDAQNIAVITVQ
jgi:hypothetical protein